MNIRPLLLTAALACSSLAGLAQANDISATSQVMPYEYGMPLHVAKVVSLTEPPTLDCKVITADINTSTTTASWVKSATGNCPTRAVSRTDRNF